mgnify:CR=1 FL=1
MNLSFSKMKFPIALSAMLGIGAVAVGSGMLQGRTQTARADSTATAAKANSNAEKPGNEGVAGNTEVDLNALSYILGVNVAQSMQDQKVPVQADNFIAGFQTAMAGNPSKYSDEEAAEVLTAFQRQQMEAYFAEHAKKSEEAMKKGKEFLEKNKAKDGISETASGLQYRVIKEGTGPKPAETDHVKVHYRGTLTDGTEFDSSYKRGEPAEFTVGRVIPGWTEALQMMPEGSKWELYIPSDLAYGPRGAGGAIGPNEVLVFEVELLEVKPEEETKPLSIKLSDAKAAADSTEESATE